jgi:hypothetical protein
MSYIYVKAQQPGKQRPCFIGFEGDYFARGDSETPFK